MKHPKFMDLLAHQTVTRAPHASVIFTLSHDINDKPKYFKKIRKMYRNFKKGKDIQYKLSFTCYLQFKTDFAVFYYFISTVSLMQ
jgi:hypothetical protein